MITLITQPSIYQALGERIAAIRLDRNMSQHTLAQRIGKNHASMSLIESGQQRCAIHELLAIAKVLRIPVADLLRGLEV